jgi:hypothetical protein
VVALALVASLAAGLAANCGDAGVGGEDRDGGADDAAPAAPAVCPEALPEEGARCALPEGTTCLYGPCGTFATCTRGAFARATSPRANLCPAFPPREGSPCGPCFLDGGACVYGDPTCADAQVPATISTCVTGRFATRAVDCDAGAGDAASTDAAAADATLDAPSDG